MFIVTKVFVYYVYLIIANKLLYIIIRNIIDSQPDLGPIHV